MMTISWLFPSRSLLAIALCVSVLLPVEEVIAQTPNPVGAIESEYDKSIVRILTTGRDLQGNPRTEHGTGVFIAEGTILTARHVVGRDEEWYRDSGRLDRSVDVIAVDDDNVARTIANDAVVRIDPFVDAALIFVNPTKRAPVEINFGDLKEISATYPFVWDKAGRIPEVRAAEVRRTDVSASGPGLRLAGDFHQGHSGAPVFDPNGRVIAIIVKGDDTDQYTLAMPVSDFRALLFSAPKFTELRRFRARINERFPSSLRDSDALRTAALTKARRTLRDEAAGYVEGLFFSRGTRIGPEKAMELVDATIKIESEQSESRVDGFVEISTRSRAVLEISSLEAVARTLEGSLQAEELQRARAREQQLILEIDRLKSKLAGMERSGPATAELQTEVGQALEGKSNELRSNDLLRRALIAKSLGREQQSRMLLDDLLKEFPSAKQARLERGMPEDNEYLVAANVTESTAPYIAVARSRFDSGSLQQSREILLLMRQLFPNIGIVEIKLRSSIPNPGPLFAGRLTLELEKPRPNGLHWIQPPWALHSSLLVAKDTVIVVSNSIDFDQDEGFALKFEGYGYAACILYLHRDDLQPGAITQKTCNVAQIKTTDRATNRVTGAVTLAGKASHDGIVVGVRSQLGKLAGFSASARTDTRGRFALDNIPNGEALSVRFDYLGFVHRDISIDLYDGSMTCHEDGQGGYRKNGIKPCDLTALKIQLHPVRHIKIEWMLQETPGAKTFEGGTSKGEVTLTSALPNDWTRGGWNCCKAAYKFGSKTIDPTAPNMILVPPDILLFTEIDGRIFFGQPSTKAIARSQIEYYKLIIIPDNIEFEPTREVEPGSTYIVKTSDMRGGQEIHYAKLKVLSID